MEHMPFRHPPWDISDNIDGVANGIGQGVIP